MYSVWLSEEVQANFTDVRGTPLSLQTNSEIIPQLGHDHFLPSPFEFIVHLLSYLYDLFPTGGLVCSHMLTPVFHSRIFLPWKWRRYVPPKRRSTQDLHSTTSQKTTFFMLSYHSMLCVLETASLRPQMSPRLKWWYNFEVSLSCNLCTSVEYTSFVPLFKSWHEYLGHIAPCSQLKVKRRFAYIFRVED
jgi:hypothetical protein